MNHVAIIPARAGSKSITNKNLQTIGTRSLVQMTIDMASKVSFFEKVILSTDIESILSGTQSSGKLWVVRRPEALATDKSEMGDVILDLIESEAIGAGDYIWLLQPTSPFRVPSDFYEIEDRLKHYEPKSLISVADVEANHPNRMYTVKGAELFPLRHNNFKNKQDLMNIYIRNGCFYVVKCKDFVEQKSFYLRPCISYPMPKRRSLNIDTEDDLLWAKTVWKYL